ncbi:hypothetical protein, partial [Leucobacter sp. M11]|uniref:hypothetical protein n=1 Tax=Leucobacter sp. M11 TaxID=2993565 RepID=UPI002D7E4A04
LVLATSIAGLAAAIEIASVGLQVRVLVPSPEGLSPAGVVRDGSGALAALVAELGDAPPALRDVPAGRTLLRAKSGALRPVPADSVFGIPSSPLAREVSALIGSGGAFRAYIDRLRPVLTIGKERFLGPLVRSRLGLAVAERLVGPLIRERYGVGPDEVEVAVAVPGLNEALTRVGSLSGGVLDVAADSVARETPVLPEGGWPVLITALRDRLDFFQAETVLADLAHAADNPDVRYRWSIRDSEGGEHLARALVTEADPAGVTGGPFAAPAARTTRTYAEFRMGAGVLAPEAAAALEAEPRGELLETLRAGSGADWSLRIVGGAHPRARLSGPRDSLGHVVTDAELRAVLAGSTLLASDPAAAAIVQDVPLRRWTEPAPELSRDDAQHRAAELAAAREARPERLAVGEAVSGPGLSSAVADARAAAVPLRRRLAGIA